MILSDIDKKSLLTLANCTIRERVAPGKRFKSDSYTLTDAMKRRGGAFVSLYVDQHLRGCIGTFSEEEPLYKTVADMAVSAATCDSRFDSIRPDELPGLVTEISILTPRKRIYEPSEIVIGLHGIYMKSGSFSGTLLPRVAVDQKWTVEEFLGNCSGNKAGMDWDGWKKAELYTYEAIVFRSDDLLFEA